MNKASYDFASRNILNIIFKFHTEQQHIEGSVYTVFDLLTEIGGILYAFVIAFTFLLGSFPHFRFTLFAMQRLFKAQTSHPSALFKKTDASGSVYHEGGDSYRMGPGGVEVHSINLGCCKVFQLWWLLARCCGVHCCWGCIGRTNAYRRRLKKLYEYGSSKVEKRMDVVYLVRKLRSLEFRVRDLSKQMEAP